MPPLEYKEATEDSELIRQFVRNGCPLAIRTLLERYEQPIYHFLRKLLGNKEDAEDTAQRSFAKVVNLLPSQYEERGSFKSWLYQIARTEALMHLRSAKRRTATIIATDRIDDMPIAISLSAGNDPQEALARDEQLTALQNAIDQLSDPLKEVVLLRLHADLPFREIARITDSPLNTVLGRMRNATLKLQSLLEVHSS